MKISVTGMVLICALGFSSLSLAQTLEEAKAERNAGHPYRAVKIYRQLLEKDASNENARRELAWTLAADLSRSHRALKVLEPLVESKKGDVGFLLQHAEIRAWSGDNRRSLQEYEDIIRDHPESEEAWAGKIQVQTWMNRFSEANETLDEAEKRFPTSARLKKRRAELKIAESDVKSALEILRPLAEQGDADAKGKIRAVLAPEFNLSASKNMNNFDEMSEGVLLSAKQRLFHPNVESTLAVDRQVFTQTNVNTVDTYRVLLSNSARLFSRAQTTLSVGEDFFGSGLASTPVGRLQFGGALGRALTVGAFVEYGTVKSTARSIRLENRATRYGPDLALTFNDRDTIYAFAQFGDYSDNNAEKQSLVKFEHRFNWLRLGLARFDWSFNEDKSRGYFAPRRFEVYAVEGAWDALKTRWLRPELKFSVGTQNYNDTWSPAQTYEALLKIPVLKQLELALNYRFSNVLDASNGGQGFNAQAFLIRAQYKP